MCLTRKAFETQSELLAQLERRRLEELAAQEKAASGAGADDFASIVYEDRPMLARTWLSTSAKETRDEVDALSIFSSRPLVCACVCTSVCRSPMFFVDFVRSCWC